ncbi:cystathionine beta-synthase (acetylserine-dependent) [Candidatus Koribacter versatilis Ellin345]|uniref:Cysteine synthase n=2 Tax=Candidatus Korobacter versatilis TaxID=658062 RepID=Q1INP9_KORVE|nr:cystathionine beta-synthase (acetylserine-dependent) [Candidatus Koribacter versatilis Ellin345]
MNTSEMSTLRVAEDISELVGQTPMLHLRKMVPPEIADIYVKLEFLNPGGSIKDRAALGMILRAEKEGVLKPGATILEATAGNTGVGLALIGVSRGYKVVLAVPQKFSKEKVMLMEALGAQVYRTPDAEGMEGAIRLVKKFLTEIPNSWLAGQFENQANPDFHYETTGRELWEQMGGKIDAIALGAGTAGTFTGVARYLKERSPQTLCVLVESQASVYGGGKSGPHAVEGIGASFIPATFDRSVCDEVIAVKDVDAFRTIKDLAAKEGVLAGSSSGAAVFASLELAKRLGPGKRVVTIIPDSAERYLSKDPYHFNE